MSKIKSFRGLIASGVQDTIMLHTNDGSTGYRIVKFQCIQAEPGELSVEQTLKIYKIDQLVTASNPTTNTIDFSDPTLLGVALWHKSSGEAYSPTDTVIFDLETFNQDIYITNADVGSGSVQAINYYLELEQMSLDLNESTVTTLKDIRNSPRPL